MSDLFLDVLNTGISASWLVLAVIGVRLVLKKAPRWLICMLWVIVAARLLLPTSIESPLSLIPSAQVITPESMYDHAPVITSGVELIDAAINPVYTESFRADEVFSVNPLQVWTAIGANLWGLGMGAMLLWAFISWLRLKRRLRTAIPDGRDVWVCDSIDTPFILGLFRPKIYLPAGLDDQRRTHVIAHERAHLQRRDHWWKPIAYLLLTVFWFHPLMWVAYILLCRDIELACDEKVIKTMSADEKKDYSTALLECSIRRSSIAACPLAFGEVGVKARIKSVLNYKKPAFWVVVLGILVCAAVAVCFLTDPVTRTPEIRYNGVLYIQEGANQRFLPENCVHVGRIQTGVVESDGHPTEDFQAVNLEEEYAGSDLYLYEAEIDLELVQILYAECPGGGYLPFRLRTPNSLIAELVNESTDIRVNVLTDNTFETEQLQDDRLVAMSLAFDSLRHAEFVPGSVGENATKLLTVQIDRQGEVYDGVRLNRYAGGQWELVITDEAYGTGSWLIQSDTLTDDLESQISRYLSRAEYGDLIFSDDRFDDPNQNVHISYKTYREGTLTMTIGIPYAISEWECEEIQDGWGDDLLGVRFHPSGTSGWVNLIYYPPGSAVASLPAGIREELTLPNGIRATTVTPESGGPWIAMIIATTEGQLLASTENVDEWWNQYGSISALTYGDIATAILGSVTLYDSGRALLADGNLLGVHLSVEDVSPTGLTLVCTQDGTLVEQLHTGSPYFIERYADGVWEALPQPEGTAWTMEAWGIETGSSARWRHNWAWLYGELPPGRYRISKGFAGKLPELGTVTALVDTTYQTCYAEFTIE